MDKDAHELYELQEALIETWEQLQEVHMLLDGTKPAVPFYSEQVAEAIAAWQAYGRVLRHLEKRVENLYAASSSTMLSRLLQRTVWTS